MLVLLPLNTKLFEEKDDSEGLNLLQVANLLKQSNYPTLLQKIVWNKYIKTAIPEYLFNFPSGKKELKDRAAISPSPFLFIYFWLCSRIQLSSPRSLQPARWPPPKSVQGPPLQPLFRCPKTDFHAFSAHCISAHLSLPIYPVSPAHTWDLKIQSFIIPCTLLPPK